jgi:hypothetical protein
LPSGSIKRTGPAGASQGRDHRAPEKVTKVVGPRTASFERLQAKGEELRKAEPTLTKEQAFAKVYTDPVLKELRSPGLPRTIPSN